MTVTEVSEGQGWMGPTCAHGHGGASHHPHGSHAVVAGGGDWDRGGVEGRGGDAVGLHHRGVMDHVRLSRIHWRGVIGSLRRSNGGDFKSLHKFEYHKQKR